MPYIPNTDDDRRAMLQRIGVKDIEELLSPIPPELRLDRPLNIPALSEMEVLREIERLAGENNHEMVCFAGGGVYDHFVPAAVETVISRPEFMTAYTPYQAEVSQGTLQVIYEFQTHICRLTGMDVANASMYDGATAAAEACLMAAKATRRKKVLVSEAVNPLYREVIATYFSGRELALVTIPMEKGRTSFSRLEEAIDKDTAGVLISQPNFFGLLEEVTEISELIHKAGGLLLVSVDPIAQALLTPPGEYEANIVTGEGQPLGLPLSFGGPLLGFFAAKKNLIRSIPGRIAARTKDVDGKTGFVLVLQTREQHIRREKATSNICTNQALCATAASVYLTLMGKTGIKNVALLSMEKAHQAAEAIYALDGFEPYFDAPFVREFAVKTPIPAAVIIERMASHNILAGIDAGRWYKDMDDCLLVAGTEKRTDEEITRLAKGLKELVRDGVLSSMS